MIAEARTPRVGAANSVVPKYAIGMAFCMAGVPGRAVIVKVKAPSAIAGGIRRCGTAACRNNAAATGNTAKATTKRLTPPYVSTAQASTTAITARVSPSRSVMPRAMESAAPLSSISLPKTPPSRKSGKKLMMKRPVPCMKVRVHLARSGSPENAAATIAAAGAANSRVKPRKARKMSRPRAISIPSSSTV